MRSKVRGGGGGGCRGLFAHPVGRSSECNLLINLLGPSWELSLSRYSKNLVAVVLRTSRDFSLWYPGCFREYSRIILGNEVNTTSNTARITTGASLKRNRSQRGEPPHLPNAPPHPTIPHIVPALRHRELSIYIHCPDWKRLCYCLDSLQRLDPIFQRWVRYYDVTFDTGLEIRDARWEPASSPCAAAARRRDFISTVLELMPSHKCPSLGRRSAPLQSRDATRPAPRSTLNPPSRHPLSVHRCDLNSPFIWYSGECSTLRGFSQFKSFCKTWEKLSVTAAAQRIQIQRMIPWVDQVHLKESTSDPIATLLLLFFFYFWAKILAVLFSKWQEDKE